MHLDNDFVLKPNNVTFYFDSVRRMTQLCIPPVGQPEPDVFWKRGNRTLKDNKRIKLLRSNDTSQLLAMTQVVNVTKFYKLTIDPVIDSDEGIYSCVANSYAGLKEVKFKVTFSGNKTNFFLFPKITFSTRRLQVKKNLEMLFILWKTWKTYLHAKTITNPMEIFC